jgi:hypothetical protein
VRRRPPCRRPGPTHARRQARDIAGNRLRSVHEAKPEALNGGVTGRRVSREDRGAEINGFRRNGGKVRST